MKRPVLALATLATLAASPALPLDLGAMSADEKAAFGQAVREYLLENPEVLVEAIDALEARKADAQAEGDRSLVAANAAALFEDDQSHVAGNPEGDLTIVEFLDYRCGYCRKAHPEIAALLQADSGIRLIVKEFPILGEQSMLASRFAIATRLVAGDDAYARVSNGLYEDFRGDITEAALRSYAEDLDLDADAILGRMHDDTVTGIIEANHQLAERLQIGGTPTFVIGEQILRGFAPLDAMQAIVAEERG